MSEREHLQQDVSNPDAVPADGEPEETETSGEVGRSVTPAIDPDADEPPADDLHPEEEDPHHD